MVARNKTPKTLQTLVLVIAKENVIFEKIQDDLRNNNLKKENNYYNGYLPVTKKKLEKLLEYRNSAIKKDEMSFLDEVLSLLHLKDFKSTD